jgi:hypothetical protein
MVLAMEFCTWDMVPVCAHLARQWDRQAAGVCVCEWRVG